MLHLPSLPRLVLILTLGPGLVAPAGAAAVAELDAAARDAIRALVRKEMKSADTAGLSLALVDDQKVVWAEGFGWADRKRRLPARADTLYSVGGLSQLFTAAAVLQWADHGVLRLDQPVQQLLPEFGIRSRFPNAGPVTVRQLLTHHSGLPSMYMRGMWTPRPESLKAFVARLRDEALAAPPGEVYSPSFPGYSVLGRMIEVLCHKDFAACLHERLLTPLGMTRSTFERHPPGLAMHYWSEKPVPSQTVRDLPAAGLSSSATELARFVQMLFANGRLDGHVILSAHSVQDMLRVQNSRVPLDLDNDVGIAWRLSGVRFPQARTVAWLGNHSPFSRGRIVIVPEHKLGVIVLTNSSNSTEAVEQISERLLALALEQKRLPVVKTAPPTTVIAATPAPTRTDIEGQYASMIGLISVQANGSRYRARTLGKTIELRPDPEGLLMPQYQLLGVIPIPISTLRETRLTTLRAGNHHLAVAYYRNAAYRFGERIAPVTLTAAWRRRLGEYRVIETDPLFDLVKMGNVHLIYTDGQLLFRYRVPGWLGLLANVPVRPVSDSELVVEGTGWMMGDSVRVVTRDGGEALRYSGYEYRRIGGP